MIKLEIEQSILPEYDRITQNTIERLEKALFAHFDKSLKGTIEIRFVDKVEIRRLNRMYRKIDKVTDVLAFEYPGAETSIGDVAICYQQAVAQAEEGKHKVEMITLLVHGVLHVLGLDHELKDGNKMFSLQDSLVEQIL